MEGILWRAGRVRSSLHTLSSVFAAFFVCLTPQPNIRIVVPDNPEESGTSSQGP